MSYTLKIVHCGFFSTMLEEEMADGANGMYLFYFSTPARILLFIPSIVCVILLQKKAIQIIVKNL